jgi:hypothetical protein
MSQQIFLVMSQQTCPEERDAAHPRKDQRKDPEREVMFQQISLEMSQQTCQEERDVAHLKKDPRRDQEREVK